MRSDNRLSRGELRDGRRRPPREAGRVDLRLREFVHEVVLHSTTDRAGAKCASLPLGEIACSAVLNHLGAAPNTTDAFGESFPELFAADSLRADATHKPRASPQERLDALP